MNTYAILEAIPSEPSRAHQQGHFADIMKHISDARTDAQRPTGVLHGVPHPHRNGFWHCFVEALYTTVDRLGIMACCTILVLVRDSRNGILIYSPGTHCKNLSQSISIEFQSGAVSNRDNHVIFQLLDRTFKLT